MGVQYSTAMKANHPIESPPIENPRVLNLAIPPEIHAKLRVEAARRGCSMRRLVLAQLLESLPALARKEIE